MQEGGLTMKRTFIKLFAALFIMATASPAMAAPDQAARQEIVKFYADLKKTLNSDAFFKDPSIGLPFFDEKQARLFDVMAPEEYTGESFRKHFIAVSVDVPGILDFINMDIHTDGKLAFVSYIMLGEGHQKDGPTYHLRSRATDCLEKTGGKWRIVHEHLSMPLNDAQFAEVLKNSP